MKNTEASRAMTRAATAGTAAFRFDLETPEPGWHSYQPEALRGDWGYRPQCLHCGHERYDDIHQEPR